MVAILGIVLVRGASGSSENFGEDVDEDDAEGRHAGAHNADIDFDGGPTAQLNLIECGVRGVGKVDEGLKTKNRDDGDT